MNMRLVSIILISILTISCTSDNENSGQLSEHYKKQLKNSLLHRTNFVESAENGDIKTVDRYLQLGMDANTKDTKNSTALMGATLNGHKKIVDLLLEYKANPLLKDQNGYTAVDYAKIHERKFIISDLQKESSIYRGLSSTSTKTSD